MNQLLRAMIHQLYMAPAGEGGGGGGDIQITPAEARTFVTGFVPDPKIIEGIDDTTAVAWHGHLTKTLGDHSKKTLETHDWRKDIAGEDPERLKTLERFASPKAVYESYDQLRTRLSKGELKAVTPYPDKGTAEQQVAWRAENGVPPSADKYELKLPNGLVIGEDDKPFVENFTKYAHEKNLPNGAVNDAVGWYFQERVARTEAAKAKFDSDKTETAATLGQEWGNEYKPNLNKIQGLLDATIPAEQAELKTLINNAIATNPHFARHYAQLALQLNPSGVLVPGDRGANEASVSDGIKRIEGIMKTDRPKYNADQKMQDELKGYYAAYQKLTGKEWGRG